MRGDSPQVVDIRYAIQLEMRALMDEVAFLAGVGNCGGNGLPGVEGFPRPSENTLLHQCDSATGNSLGMPAQIIPSRKDTRSDNRFTCTASADFNRIAIMDEQSNIRRDFLHCLADFHSREWWAKLFRSWDFDESVDFTQVDKIIAPSANETLIHFSNHRACVLYQLLLIPYPGSETDEPVVIRWRDVKQSDIRPRAVGTRLVPRLTQQCARTHAMIAPLFGNHLSNGFREIRAGVPGLDHERLCCF